MIETEQRYDLKSIINNVKEYYQSDTFAESKSNQLEIILFKLNNIDAILENVDEDIIGTTIMGEYNNCVSYSQYVVKGNDSYLSSLNDSVDNMFSKVFKYIDYNMLLGNNTKIKKYIRDYKFQISRQIGIIESEVQGIKDLIHEKTTQINNDDSELNKNLLKLSDELKIINVAQEELKKNIEQMLEEEKKNAQKRTW